MKALQILFTQIVQLAGNWQALVSRLIQDMANSTTTLVVTAVGAFCYAFFVSEALLAKVHIREAQIPASVRVLTQGAHANAIAAVGVVADAIVGQPAVLAKVAGLVASTFPFYVVRTFATLTRVVTTFGVRAQQILTLIVVLAEIAYGSCKSNAVPCIIVREHKVTLEAGTDAESSRRRVMFAVCVRWTIRVCSANARCTSDESLARRSRQNCAGDEEGQYCEPH